MGSHGVIKHNHFNLVSLKGLPSIASSLNLSNSVQDLSLDELTVATAASSLPTTPVKGSELAQKRLKHNRHRRNLSLDVNIQMTSPTKSELEKTLAIVCIMDVKVILLTV